MKKLKLVLDIYSSQDAQLSHEKFLRVAQTLYLMAMDTTLPVSIERGILNGKNEAVFDESGKIEVSKNIWINHVRDGYNLNLTIEVQGH